MNSSTHSILKRAIFLAALGLCCLFYLSGRQWASAQTAQPTAAGVEFTFPKLDSALRQELGYAMSTP